jgi:hypothetical protein
VLVIEPFMEVVVVMFAAEFLKSAKLAVTELLIEAARLKAERV